MAQAEDNQGWPSELLDEERYEAIRGKLIRCFAARRCYDPAELADETILRAVRKFASWRRGDVAFEAFVFGFTRFVALERCHGRKGETQLDDASLGVAELIGLFGHAAATSEEEAIECLRRCLQKMERPEQELILRYYQGGDKEGELKRARKQLAKQLDLSLKALRQRTLRLRNKLERCVKDCLSPKISEAYSGAES